MAQKKPTVEQQVAETVVKKTRGGKQASLEKNFNGTRDELGAIIQQSVEAWKQPLVKDDDECAERLNAYFKRCSDNQILPTVEEMCLYLGAYRDKVWDWENGRGCSQIRRDMIKKAKQIMSAIDAKAAATGKIQPVVYIFRAKNYYGLRDQQDVIITPNNPLGDTTDQKALEARLDDIVVDVDEVQ